MSFSVTILGSSSALPTAKRNLSAHVLNVHEHFYLIDCGEATQMQMRRFKIPISKINHIFITHLHGDHFLGLFGLISTFSILGRKCDLNIYAHADLEKIIQNLEEYLAPQFKIVFYHLQPSKHQLIYENKHITVHTVPLKHRVPACGFIFKEKLKPFNIRKEMIPMYNLSIADIVKIKNGDDFITDTGEVIENAILTTPPALPISYAYISDTRYSEKIIPYIKDVNLLYHETTYLHDLADLAKERMHSTALQAGEIARLANAKQLLIGHFSIRYTDVQPLLNEAMSVFPNTVVADDGKTIDICEMTS